MLFWNAEFVSCGIGYGVKSLATHGHVFGTGSQIHELVGFVRVLEIKEVSCFPQ
jgi:hypothetical protein